MAGLTLLLLVLLAAAGCEALSPQLVDSACSVRMRWLGDRNERGAAIAPAAISLIALVDGKSVVASCDAASLNRIGGCTATIPKFGRAQSVYSYVITISNFSVASAGPPAVIPAVNAANAHACGSTLLRAAASGPPVGILYEVWHPFATNFALNATAKGFTPVSVEDVLRASPPGSLTLYDVVDRYGPRTLSDNFFFQEYPVGGPYCIYRHRPGEVGITNDCVNITATLTRHAAMLTSIGIDFVTPDATNIGTLGDEGDVIQARPVEVLFEEWTALRLAGHPTPAIAAWQRSEAGGTLWQNWLDLYNNASYAGLVHRAVPSGKKVFFTPSNPDPAVVAKIESNGGRNDVVVVVMWANDEKGTVGEWGFMSPCRIPDSDSPGTFTYTTSIVGLGRGASGCGQQWVNGSALGSCVSVSPSYQLMYGSVPFSSANKYDGLTFKRQWAAIWEAAGRVFEDGSGGIESSTEWRSELHAAATAALPDNVYVSSFNEWISQPQPNPYNPPTPAPGQPNFTFAFDMGLYGDNLSSSLFVDSYGWSTSRDIEPSNRPGGGVIFDLLGSCLRVLALLNETIRGVLRDDDDGSGTGAFSTLRSTLASTQLNALRSLFGRKRTTAHLAGGWGASCSVAGEACCEFNATVEEYVPVWSFTATNGTDWMPTADVKEVEAFSGPGSGLRQVCTAYPGQTDFCTDKAIVATFESWQGPFILHGAGCGARSAGSDPTSDPSIVLPGRTPLLRCRSSGGTHFLAAGLNGCGGGGSTVDQVLGCVADTRTSNMARPLRRCTNANKVAYVVTDGVCWPGDEDGGTLGYVR